MHDERAVITRDGLGRTVIELDGMPEAAIIVDWSVGVQQVRRDVYEWLKRVIAYRSGASMAEGDGR